MQAFQMTSKMTTMQGVFYPTGYSFLMFPDAQNAQQAGQQLEAAGFVPDEVMLLTPQVILKEIGRITDDDPSAVALPSVGTEGATVNRYINLAREGHHALMVKTSSDEESERMMSILRELPLSFGQRYHMLVIEDLE